MISLYWCWSIECVCAIEFTTGCDPKVDVEHCFRKLDMNKEEWIENRI